MHVSVFEHLGMYVCVRGCAGDLVFVCLSVSICELSFEGYIVCLVLF